MGRDEILNEITEKLTEELNRPPRLAEVLERISQNREAYLGEPEEVVEVPHVEKTPQKPSQTVPLTVYKKNGRLANPGEGERVVIGEAYVHETDEGLEVRYEAFQNPGD